MSIIATTPSPATPPPATSNRASLAGMPTEIKARIVELAWYQDEQHRTTPRWVASEPLQMKNYRDGLSRTVRALFEVNKEFSELAAKYLFRSLSTEHKTKSVLFHHRILPLHARHFVHLYLVPKTKGDLTSYFSSILRLAAQLPNLESLELDARCQELYLPRNGVVDELEGILLMGSFDRLTSRVQELSFYEGWTAQMILRVLRGVRTIKKLEIVLGDGVGSLRDCRALLNYVSQKAHLESLHLVVCDRLGEDFWTNFDTTSLSRLTSLSCWHSDDDLGGVVSRLAGQLLELSTSLKSIYTSSASSSAPTPLSFPLLQKLDLSDEENMGGFSGCFGSSFPRVASLILPCLLEGEFSFDEIHKLFLAFPSLVSLDISFRPSLSATQSAYLLQLCAQRKIHLKCNSLYSSAKPTIVELPMTLAEYEAREAFVVDGVKRVVNFTARRIEMLEALGDLEEIKRMAPFTEGLERVMGLETNWRDRGWYV